MDRNQKFIKVQGLISAGEHCMIDVEKLTGVVKEGVLVVDNNQVFVASLLENVPTENKTLEKCAYCLPNCKSLMRIRNMVGVPYVVRIAEHLSGYLRKIKSMADIKVKMSNICRTGFGFICTTSIERLRNQAYINEEDSALPPYPVQMSDDQREDRCEQHASERFTSVPPNTSFAFSSNINQPPWAFDRPTVPRSMQHDHDIRFDTPFLTRTVRPPFQSSGTPPRHPDYQNSDRRFKSYEHWTHINPSAKQLTEDGFFFTNQADLVRCFQCGIGLKDFSPEDDPLLEHVRHSGQCPFLLQFPDAERLQRVKRQLQETGPEYNRQSLLNGRHHAVSALHIRHPKYQTLEARLATFRRWPSGLMQTPSMLAEAGLFYTGVEDHVRCFACDAGLRRWDPEDDPWTEHCRWFPGCPFCIEQKGEEFIALLQASLDENDDETLETALKLTVNSPKVRTVYEENKELYIDMGFQEDEVKQAILELMNTGVVRPDIDDIVEQIYVVSERNAAERAHADTHDESPAEENARLKKLLFCKVCEDKVANALFLPCTHHKLCMDCAEPLKVCPMCNMIIREKIKTHRSPENIKAEREGSTPSQAVEVPAC